MSIIDTILLGSYIVGVILCFDLLTSKIDKKFPFMEFTFLFKIAICILCCFSWIGIYFVLTNDELNS